MVCPVLVLLCRRERSLDPVIRQQRLRPESRRAGQDRLQLQRRHLHRHRRPARVFRGGRPPRALLPGPASAGGAGDPPRSHRQDQGRRRRLRGVRPRPAGADARSPQPAAAGAAFGARPARVPALTRIRPAGSPRTLTISTRLARRQCFVAVGRVEVSCRCSAAWRVRHASGASRSWWRSPT
jgi:hypothetical protein